MKKLLVTLLVILSLVGCSSKVKPTPVVLEPVSVEELVSVPERDLLRLPVKNEIIKTGMDDGEITGVIVRNNNKARDNETRLIGLQQYVCSLFKKSVGEACSDNKR